MVKGRQKVYLDASVIIAAILSPTGGSAEVIKKIQNGNIVGITSQTVIDEIEANLDKIGKTDQEINEFIHNSNLIVREHLTQSDVSGYQGLIDPEDAHLIAGARLTKCDYLLSLDKKHLLTSKVQAEFKPLKIISPGEFLRTSTATIS